MRLKEGVEENKSEEIKTEGLEAIDVLDGHCSNVNMHVKFTVILSKFRFCSAVLNGAWNSVFKEALGQCWSMNHTLSSQPIKDMTTLEL